VAVTAGDQRLTGLQQLAASRVRVGNQPRNNNHGVITEPGARIMSVFPRWNAASPPGNRDVPAESINGTKERQQKPTLCGKSNNATVPCCVAHVDVTTENTLPWLSFLMHGIYMTGNIVTPIKP
jgi:hypothetical protein